MQNSIKNTLTKLTFVKNTNLVLVDGVFKQELSAAQRNFAFTEKDLTIPKNTQILEPIHLLFISQNNAAKNFNINIGEKSSAVIFAEYIGLENPAYTNTIKLNINLEKDSVLSFYKVQNENENAKHHATTFIQQNQNSSCNLNFISQGAAAFDENLQVALKAESARFSANGIICLQKQQKAAFQALIEHLVPNCTSNILFKEIINDKARGVFKARVIVKQNAQHSETHLTNKNLLLSDTATINTAPELEIYADDVICTHGATIGQLDKQAIFYLTTRGLDTALAKQILMRAFVGEILANFPELLKNRVTLFKE
ncbi:MAG: Fe-S cluster assembly protein SufD [Gammaproteobacteria bacterium]|nr:Fe-S cluster assembly protein SufD [Gammaproteobacteria bacterium]